MTVCGRHFQVLLKVFELAGSGGGWVLRGSSGGGGLGSQQFGEGVLRFIWWRCGG